jgi:methyl-accepting chemotaxis protein
MSRDEVRDLEEIFAVMVNDLRAMISDIKNASLEIQETNVNLTKLASKVLSNSQEIDQSAMARG